MKKAITTIGLLAGAISGYPQGELDFNFYNGAPGQVSQSIWNEQGLGSYNPVTYAGHTVFEQFGSTSAVLENPKGTTVYSGTGLSGTAYDIQLLAGPAGITSTDGTSSANGANNVGLIPVSSIFHFKTSPVLLGYMSGSQSAVTLPPEPYFSVGDQVSLAVAAWDNEGGTMNSLAAAVAAGALWGISPVVTTTYANGLPVAPSGSLPLPTTLESFSLGIPSDIPEPGTMAFGVGSVAMFLFCRWNRVQIV